MPICEECGKEGETQKYYPWCLNGQGSVDLCPECFVEYEKEDDETSSQICEGEE